MAEELDGPELGAAIALEVCGHPEPPLPPWWPGSGYQVNRWTLYPVDGGGMKWAPPAYWRDLNLCREAEQEIERRGLHRKFAFTLQEIVSEDLHGSPSEFYYRLIHADAETRCRAMLAVVREAKPR